MAVLIGELLDEIKLKETKNLDYNLQISEICDNSTKCIDGCLFVCINGFSTNGELYVNEAMKNGAVAIVCEKKLDVNIAQIVVEDCRSALALICKNFYKKACNKLKIIGIVGTNGKSSCSEITCNMLNTLGHKAGLIGTNVIKYGGQVFSTNLTTPDPIELHKTFFQMLNRGVEYVVMEVSAHAIFLKKTEGIVFETLLFTNISQDHLDFFENMEKYSSVKIGFFNGVHTKSAVVNVDDEYSNLIIKQFDLPLLTYALKNPSDVFAINVKMNLKGTKFIVNLCDDILKVETSLCALFNVYNLIGCMGVLKILGYGVQDIKKSLTNISQVGGRFNLIECGQKFNVVLDYAHTPKSLEVLLTEVKKLSKQKVITVFGCPGNRDESKREIMGEIAGKNSCFVVITTDNPQYENAFLIMKQIETGIKKTNCQYLIVEDRKLAIECAMSVCDENTCLVVVGKGTEEYQNINGFKVEYSDRATIIECLQNKQDKKHKVKN